MIIFRKLCSLKMNSWECKRLKSSFIPRRALLYVPGCDDRKILKARNINADLIVLDCEDGVAINQKESARSHILNILNEKQLPAAKPQWGVRVNSVSSNLCESDLKVVLNAENKPPCLLLPKVESVDEVKWFMETVSKLNPPDNSMDLIMYSETAKSMLNLYKITEAAVNNERKKCLKLVALVFGSDDYTANIGATRTKSCSEVLYARQRLVMIAKAFDLQAIDMVHIDIKDLEGLKNSSIESANWGFTGRQVIHPDQVSIVQTSYSPSKEKINWAMELVKAFDAHQHLGKGAFVFQNQMIDMPTLKQAQNILILVDRHLPTETSK